MKPNKSQRRAIYEAGMLWLDAMRQQFVNINRQGRVAESRQRAARGRAAEALSALRCVMARVRAESGVAAVPERPAEPLYRPFRVGEAVVDGMVVWIDDNEFEVCAHPNGWLGYAHLKNPDLASRIDNRQVIHACALLRVDSKDGGK